MENCNRQSDAPASDVTELHLTIVRRGRKDSAGGLPLEFYAFRPSPRDFIVGVAVNRT
jgi:hypothetical protein